MPIEHKREGNQCERCKKLQTEVGKITHYTKHGADLLLCPKCLKFREKTYTEKCPKCKRVAYEHGGLTIYDDSDVDDTAADGFVMDDTDDFNNFDNLYDEEPPNFDNVMCEECYEKKLTKAKKIRKAKLTIKNYIKSHYWKIIFAILGIIGIIVGISL